MSRTESQEWWRMLAGAGVERVYMARNPKAVEPQPGQGSLVLPCGASAAFAALGEAMLTGGLGVCHLADDACAAGRALAEAAGSRVPLLALVEAEPVAGKSEKILPENRFAASPGEALRHALAHRTAAIAPAEGCEPVYGEVWQSTAVPEPDMAAVQRMAELLNGCNKVAFLCGGGCAGAHDELVELAQRLGAPVAYTLRGKDIMEKDNPCAVGMIGLLGWGDAPAAVHVADVLVIWGADFPYSCFLPQHGRVIQVDADAAALGRRVRLCHAVHGDVGRTAALLLPLLRGGHAEDFLSRSLMRHGKAVAQGELAVWGHGESEPMRPEFLTRLISSRAEPDAVFVVDMGPPLVWAARYVQALGNRRLMGAFATGAVGSALAMALGAKAAAPSRQVIAMCTVDSLLRMWAVLRVMVQNGLSVKVLVYNVAPAFAEPLPGEAPPAAGVDAVALARCAGMEAQRIASAGEAPAAVRHWLAERGPALLEAALDPHARAYLPESDLLRTLHYQGSAPACRDAATNRAMRLLYGK